jgi:hypothetical protein
MGCLSCCAGYSRTRERESGYAPSDRLPDSLSGNAPDVTCNTYTVLVSLFSFLPLPLQFRDLRSQLIYFMPAVCVKMPSVIMLSALNCELNGLPTIAAIA